MSTPSYFHRVYDETMALLLETRNYVAYGEMANHEGLSLQSRLQASFESMRVTSRLTQVMAWLLAQRAVVAGEISERTLVEDFALGGDSVCLGGAEERDEAHLPRALRSLLGRSLGLYHRVGRLDAMARRRCAMAADADGNEPQDLPPALQATQSRTG